MKKLLKGYLIAILGLVFLIVLILGMFAGNSNQCQSTNTSVTVTTSADKEAVAQSIHDNLKKISGVTEAGIAGYLGNMEVESGFNPKSIESNATYDESKAMNTSLSGYAFGLNQWDSARRVALLTYAKTQNKQWSDPSLQLDFALNHDGTNSDLLKQGLKMTDVNKATEFLRAKWERGGQGTTTKRQAFARNWYAKFSNGTSNTAVDTATNGTETTQNTDNTTNNTSGCATNLIQGMGTSGAPVKEIPSAYKNKIKDTNFTATSSTNTYAFGQCTWYVYNRMQELGTPVENGLGNGADWGKNAKAKGYKTDSQPHVGWAVSFSQGADGADATYGHVAVVEAISDDGKHFLVSECNVVSSGSGTVSFRELTAGTGVTFIQGK
ncbi:N-acetylmuramoyl-L-alanine amidase domain-containing protein precursor [Leuconostoc suionicum]|uniref:N-acetylmuramoyl-L-alanine amidase domain-containing protein n=1 Tax=Leuconostoc suionicum TaxID=1511761 RepID=A0A2N9K9N1_9LACO|nr:phage tail tip lysozyme [Leuconostoc suionicum]SPD91502.1 N-acetylmuramoyl-L-alanine amidase domain-containing protein precursor [Leuconostoc suionicum]SPE06727.1 N-acetylmuramoyl-L-alanine amidase domain-containing protein precursor [Leuconostoc suionicum]SPH03234.1 N-acetylmuramoyl-L-alanine amidase domain-containing protein precursor [Leuconostoc suionicum]